jgi:non-homologous end joining protein Ku
VVPSRNLLNHTTDTIDTKADDNAVKLAIDLIEQESGRFEPQKMPNEYASAVHELVQAKIKQRAPEVEIETGKGEPPKVVNIMDARALDDQCIRRGGESRAGIELSENVASPRGLKGKPR